MDKGSELADADAKIASGATSVASNTSASTLNISKSLLSGVVGVERLGSLVELPDG